MHIERLVNMKNKEVTIKILASTPKGLVEKIVFEDEKNTPVIFFNIGDAINSLEKKISDD